MHFLRRSCAINTRGALPRKTGTLLRLEKPATTAAPARSFNFLSFVRLATRIVWLSGEVVLALLDFIINVVFRPKLPLARARAIWLQQTCRTALRILKVEIRTEGTIPSRGILACKHLSYLDVLVISAITPTIFVSRSEIRRWPLFGWFAALAGTLFVRSSRRNEVTRVNREMTGALEDGNLVVLFPERNGSAAPASLPFRPALLEPAARLRLPLTTAAISYLAFTRDLSASKEREEVGLPEAPCWLELLSGNGFASTICFTAVDTGFRDRKELAVRLRHQVREFQESASVAEE